MAKGKLTLVNGGYNSLYSLGSEVELLPDKKQVYSFRFHLSPSLATQFVSAKVYIPESQSVKFISLVSTNDYVEWQAKWLYPKESGWYQVWLNMKNDSSTTGNSIVELHNNIFLSQADTIIVRATGCGHYALKCYEALWMTIWKVL